MLVLASSDHKTQVNLNLVKETVYLRTSRLIITKLCASSEISLDSANLGFSADVEGTKKLLIIILYGY